ncbi:phosphoserine aminotransferase [Coccidioides immitis H538.4]|uniref:Phosphoserine aminotransferase n=1 Tax=Coccidioides immitis H538.4 TaxID=396776 RepID=A0A0J8RWV3_COCIT|nr:phosphoserine aminotransferase [Coccidioides immitis H538.4]
MPLIVSLATSLTGRHHPTVTVQSSPSHAKRSSSTQYPNHTPIMPSRSEVAYFGAGPAPLPTPVVEGAAKAFVNFNDAGLGLGEISHRSPTANKILAETKEALTTLLDVPDNYEILFMQAGGSGEFSAVVYNLVSVWVERRRRKINAAPEETLVAELKKQVEEELKLDYLVTGSWSLKASQEAARLLGEKYVNVAVDARKDNGGKFGKIPSEETWNLTKTKKEGGKAAPAFVYFCPIGLRGFGQVSKCLSCFAEKGLPDQTRKSSSLSGQRRACLKGYRVPRGVGGNETQQFITPCHLRMSRDLSSIWRIPPMVVSKAAKA